MAPQPKQAAFPYRPLNKFHAGIKAQFVAMGETPRSIDTLTSEVDAGNKLTEKAIRDIAKAIEKNSGPRQTLPDSKFVEETLGKIANSVSGIEQALQAFGRRDKDNVTALYAAAVDTTGDIVDRTVPGKWLIAAKYNSLKDIVASGKGKSGQQRRAEFIRRLRDEAANFNSGLPAVMTDDEIGRFYDLVPAVLKAITDSQNP